MAISVSASNRGIRLYQFYLSKGICHSCKVRKVEEGKSKCRKCLNKSNKYQNVTRRRVKNVCNVKSIQSSCNGM